MKPTIPVLLQDLRDNLDLLGCDLLSSQVDRIAEAYKLEQKPAAKKKIVSKPKAKEVILNLEITEAGRTTSLQLEEKKAESYLKLKQKERAKKIDLFLKTEGVYAPTQHGYSQNDKDAYKRDSEKYLAILDNAGLNFEVKITTC